LINQVGLQATNELLQEDCRLPFTSPEQVLRCTKASIENTPKPSWLETTLVPVVQAVGGFLIPGSSVAAQVAVSGTQALESPNVTTRLNPVQRFLNQGGNMGFFDDIFNSDDAPGDNFNAGISGGGGFDWGNLLNTGVNIAGNLLGGGGRSQGVPQTYQANMGAVPMVIGAGGAVVRSGGALLAARLTSLGLTRATAWNMLKKFGPASLVGVGLTSLEIAQIARSKGGYRRMNMCNGRALRRASRRLEGFHKFYKRTCALPVRQRKSYKRCK
jgi:hypothetical protein